LQRYFGIRKLLDETSAEWIWDCANSQLPQAEFSAQGILKKFRVQALCTSDDPCDDLAQHRALAAASAECAVYPTFRPDKALVVHDQEAFNLWVRRLEEACGCEIGNFAGFLSALQRRHDYFHANGARLSDHGLPYCYATACKESEAAAIFSQARNGIAASPAKQDQFASFMMLFFGRLDAEKGWTKQLHVGALRAVNTRAEAEHGSNTGFDTIGDHSQAASLCCYLDALERDHALPKTIIYNLNPADNYAFAAAIGNFQDGSLAGKIQFGSAWWFLDQKEGIELQLNALSNTGLLARFIGMVTDSRSFMSFPRHEYFRRVLCNLIGRDMENGELPRDEALLGGMVRNLCFENARKYLDLPIIKNPIGSQSETVSSQRTDRG
jgi:glucuronate isomerase